MSDSTTAVAEKKAKKTPKAKKAKNGNRAKIRAYVFGDLMVVVARSKEEAVARFIKADGPENVEPTMVKVGFAY